jgi:signal transduction histidine kinase
MFVGGPIYDKENKIISALLLRIDPTENYFKIFNAARIGRTGETYTVNKDFTLTSESRFNQDLRRLGLIKPNDQAVLNLKINAPLCNLLTQKCKKNITTATPTPTIAAASCIQGINETNTTGYKDYRGIKVIGSWKWNQELNTCIITEINEDEAYSTLKTINKLIWFLAFIISLAITAAILFYTIVRKKNSEERVQKRIAVTEKLASLGEMAGALAHEINSPLGAIILNLDELKYISNQKKITNEIVNELTDDILNSANSISKIVKGIKSFSRHDSNDPFVKINIWDVINESLDISENCLKNSSITINIPTDQSPIYVSGSQTSLMQVFVNLFNNSRDALKNSSDAKWIKLSVKEINEQVCIYFTDSGNGIPKEIQSKIFSPFFTTKDVGEGTGLGLGITHNIVKAHGGEIKIDDQHKHTRFIIKLPRYNS